MKKQKMHRRVTQSCTGVKIGCHSVMHRSHRRVPRSCTGVTACHSAMHRIQDSMSLSQAQESQHVTQSCTGVTGESLSHAQESRQHVTQPCTGFKTGCHSVMHRSHRRVTQSCIGVTGCHSAMHRNQDSMSLSHAQESRQNRKCTGESISHVQV